MCDFVQVAKLIFYIPTEFNQPPVLILKIKNVSWRFFL